MSNSINARICPRNRKKKVRSKRAKYTAVKNSDKVENESEIFRQIKPKIMFSQQSYGREREERGER